MIRTFHPHQKEAFSYTMQEQHPALFMEMRLGKTLVAIRRIKLYRESGRILVVAPNSAIGSWEDELAMENERSVQVLSGTGKERLALLAKPKRWTLTNKESFLYLPELAKVKWDAVVFDESHWIKNPKSNITKFFCKNFRDVPHRWVLTGTPIPENDLEIFEQLRFLDGEVFGFKSYWKFRSQCYETYTGQEWFLKPGTAQAISRAIGDRCCIQTRKSAGVFDDKIFETRLLNLPKDLRKEYNNIEQNFELGDNNNNTTVWATQRWQWLRQLCGGTIEEFSWDGKVLELISLLQNQLRNESVVVWFSYNSEIKRVAHRLVRDRIKFEVLTGEDSRTEQRKSEKRFQMGHVQVLLVQAACAQSGINLSKADTAIYYSEPVSATAYQQSQDRILSLDKKSPLLYIYLVVKDTVDQDIHHTGKGKKDRSDKSLREAIRERRKNRGR